MLDYVVAPQAALSLIKGVTADFHLRETHKLLRIELGVQTAHARIREWLSPKPFVHPPLATPPGVTDKARRRQYARKKVEDAAEQAALTRLAQRWGWELQARAGCGPAIPPGDPVSDDVDWESDEHRVNQDIPSELDAGEACGPQDAESHGSKGDEQAFGPPLPTLADMDALMDAWWESHPAVEPVHDGMDRESWVPDCMQESPAFHATRHAAEPISAAYAEWVTRLESMFLEVYGTEPDRSRSFRGRARPEGPRMGVVRAVRAFAPGIVSPEVNWWRLVALHLSQYTKLSVDARGSLPHGEHYQALCRLLAEIPAPRYVNLAALQHHGWRQLRSNLGEASQQQLRDSALAARHNASAGVRALARANTAQFSAWLSCTAASSIGVLHRMVRDPVHAPIHYRCYDGALVHPVDVMDAKREAWARKWKEGADSAALAQFLRSLDAQIEGYQGEALPEITEEAVSRALSTQRTSAGRGVDNLGPKDLKRAGRLARTDLAKLFGMIEASRTWPSQLLLVFIALQPKPAGG